MINSKIIVGKDSIKKLSFESYFKDLPTAPKDRSNKQLKITSTMAPIITGIA
mgnify:CR=1 FL=1